MDELFTRVWKEPAFTVAAADRTWVGGLVRSWLGAADQLVADSGAAPYQDAVVTGELIRATLTDDPSKRVFPPSLQNYPSLEANEQARRAVIMGTINDRLVAAELAQLESAHRKVVGGGGGGGTSGGGGGNGTGGGSGGGAGGGGGKAKAAEPTRAGDAGDGDGGEDDDNDPDPGPRRSRNQRRRESQSAHGASSAGVGTVVTKTIEELIRAGALSGAPGGVPSAGPHDRPFVIDPEVMSKASVKGLGSCGSTRIPNELLERWREAAAAGRAPAATDDAVRRVAGNAITRGTAERIADDIIVGRQVQWHQAVTRTPELGGARGLEPERHGCDGATRPVAERRAVSARYGREARQAQRKQPQRLPLLAAWFVSVVAVTSLPAYAANSATVGLAGSLDEYTSWAAATEVERRFGDGGRQWVEEHRYGKTTPFDPHGLRHTAAFYVVVKETSHRVSLCFSFYFVSLFVCRLPQ